jgi:hypothetical protein
MKLWIVLSIIAISLLGCDQLPPSPDIWKCVYVPGVKFRCANVKTKEKINISLDSPAMQNALCLSIEDYKKSERWVSQIEQMAQKRCK